MRAPIKGEDTPFAGNPTAALRFRRDEPGTRFAAALQAALIIRDLGGSAPAEPAAPATPPTP